uniref:hypothetical protein n=1 Tax=Polynucleobacter sp. TaxID=2029855 RepID=UPI00404754DB
MSNHKKGQSTGPKTQDGKAVSAQNARKDSIFVQGYLSWENQDAKRLEFDALIKQWRAKDPTRLIMIRSIEQSALSMERMMYAQAKKIEGLMQSVTVARDFCERAGLLVSVSAVLPHWFFLEDGNQEKQEAIKLAKVYDQAWDLKSSYSDQLVSEVKDQYPILYTYVMTGYKEGSSFVSVLGHRYKQSMPTMNLVKLMNDLKENFPHHFIWAEDPDRYQIIIDGLRAEQMEQAMDLDKTNRYATNIQNRIAKGVATLAAIDQHEYQLQTNEQLSGKAHRPILSDQTDLSPASESSE